MMPPQKITKQLVRRQLMRRFILSVLLSLAAFTAQAEDVHKVVYHVTAGIDSASGALYNIQNHLTADPKAKIVVVANGAGIDFLVSNAKDHKGREFSGMVSDLASQGVEFRVCNNTLISANIDPSKLLMEASVVPSGVAEAARLQLTEGYAYIKP
jgi:intracellular sulfur oxidation DsrE/DsrF family protein